MPQQTEQESFRLTDLLFFTSSADTQYTRYAGVKVIRVCWLVGCLTSQQQASVSQGRICSDNYTCCHTEIEVADQTFYLTQSQYTDTGPTSPSTDPITPSAWQGSHWSANFEVSGMTQPRKKSQRKRDSNPGSSALEVDALPLGQRGSVASVPLLTSTSCDLTHCWGHTAVKAYGPHGAGQGPNALRPRHRVGVGSQGKNKPRDMSRNGLARI